MLLEMGRGAANAIATDNRIKEKKVLNLIFIQYFYRLLIITIALLRGCVIIMTLPHTLINLQNYSYFAQSTKLLGTIVINNFLVLGIF